MTKKVSSGVVHEVPKDLKDYLLSFPNVYQIWDK